MPQPPTPAAIAAILAPNTRWKRWADIYESDNVTVWKSNVPITEGNVAVDETRSERRNCDLTIQGTKDPEIFNSHLSLWYDKIIKPYRGVCLPDGSVEGWKLGEFLIDEINEPRFPKTIEIKSRDLTKMGLQSKFELATTFAAGQSLEHVVGTIASNAGFEKKILPVTGVQLGAEFAFEAGTERWKAMEELVVAYGYEIFVDSDGYFVLREIIDPMTGPVSWRFQTGSSLGNLYDYGVRSNDSRLYNHIFVTGKAADDSLVWGEAKNLEPSSPTRIRQPGETSGLSERLFRFHSDFINTFAQAQTVADNFLAIHSLEAFELNLEALVFPWLEAGEVIEFVNPEPHTGDTEISRWRMSNFTIPVNLDRMPAVGKRIQVVG